MTTATALAAAQLLNYRINLLLIVGRGGLSAFLLILYIAYRSGKLQCAPGRAPQFR